MARNGGAAEHDYCAQAKRLLRIEAEMAEMEARRRADVDKTMEVLKGMVGQLDTALGFFSNAKKQIENLTTQVKYLTQELSKRKRVKRSDRK
jgi:predicted  nucleic acid-binding Zn-ribbon protein